MIRHCFIVAIGTLLLLPIHLSAQFSSQLESDVSVRDILEGHERNPRSDTYYLIALAAARKNNIEEAEKAIKTGLSINPRNTRLMNLQGAVRARQGRLAEARRYFLNVLRLDPENRYAETSLRSIENTLQPKRNTVEMINRPQPKPESSQPETPIVNEIQSETKTRILEASYFREIKNTQRCYYSMSSLQLAYQRYLDSNPKEKDFSMVTLIEKGYLTSIPVCPKGGKYSFEDPDIVCSVHGKQSEAGAEVTTVFNDFNRGMKAKLSRNFLDALKAFEQVVLMYPRWAEAHYQLGDTLFRLGETQPAIVALRTCLKHKPDNLDAKLLLANLYFKNGQKNAALKLLDKVAKNNSGTVYGLSARSIAKSIRSGRNYYQIFPPN